LRYPSSIQRDLHGHSYNCRTVKKWGQYLSEQTKIEIAPFLSVRNGAKAIEFYKSAFGAVESFRHDGDDASVAADLSVSGAKFWVADESPEHQNFSPETLKGGTVRMIMRVEDPDTAFARPWRQGLPLSAR
jgi:PhnB protein